MAPIGFLQPRAPAPLTGGGIMVDTNGTGTSKPITNPETISSALITGLVVMAVVFILLTIAVAWFLISRKIRKAEEAARSKEGGDKDAEKGMGMEGGKERVEGESRDRKRKIGEMGQNNMNPVDHQVLRILD